MDIYLQKRVKFKTSILAEHLPKRSKTAFETTIESNLAAGQVTRMIKCHFSLGSQNFTFFTLGLGNDIRA